MLEQSHTSLKKEVKIKTVPEILLCHFSCKTPAKLIIKFTYQHLCQHFFIYFSLTQKIIPIKPLNRYYFANYEEQMILFKPTIRHWQSTFYQKNN
ncbi:MAG TPA: hypothetical protein DIT95_00890 [Arenibacter sp.]|jgi:hypothetical protein|nr:hypothetical protein [Arenibacter sp.]|tara:strand:- start:5124 stop:5408 length:285 start_codon:yes stop_codon:yes gene_type:complete